MQYPECKFAKTVSIKAQWEHTRSEAMEIQFALTDLNEAKPTDRLAKARKVVEELADLRHSAETLARVIRREYPEIDLDAIDAMVINKNFGRGYYE